MTRATPRRATTMRCKALAGLCATVAALLLMSASASATSVYTHPFITSFDGAGSQGTGGATGPFQAVDHIAIDQSTQTVYVLDPGHGVVLDKFSAAGAPQNFTALGAGVNSVSYGCDSGESDLAVDNSGGASQGRIYVDSDCGSVHAFEPTGTELGGNFPISLESPCGVAVDPSGNLWITDFHSGVEEFDSSGANLHHSIAQGLSCHTAIDASQPPDPLSGYFYVGRYGDGGPNVDVYNAAGTFMRTLVTDSGSARAIAVDPATHHVYVDDGDHVSEFDSTGHQIGTIGLPSSSHGLPNGLCGGANGVALDDTTGDLYVADCNRVDIFGPGETEIFPTVETGQAGTQPTSATLRGHVDADGGGDTTNCHFEWGESVAYGNSVPCSPAGPIHNTDGNTAVSAAINHLTEGQEYHFRLVASNGNGPTDGEDAVFRAQAAPTVSNLGVTDVKTDGATFRAVVDPKGGDTTYRFEIGTDTSYGTLLPVPDGNLDRDDQPQAVTVNVTGLAPGTSYHFRIVAHNGAGTLAASDQEFTTFPTTPETTDTCANAFEREQTRASMLLDCRAYELVSAANTGGYDVQSDLIQGQTTLVAYPDASDKVLYSLHDGAIPGIAGSPTNLGLEPYVASRGANGWTTHYVGLPSTGLPSASPYGSPLASADGGLNVFAFGGQGLCSPCFGGGGTGTPIRLRNGELVQGMAGSIPVADPQPAGLVEKSISADGGHFIFGSTDQFEPDGNSNGDVSIYDRNLDSGVTHVVSKTPGGVTMTGNGIVELDISADGSRVLIGQKVGADANGNALYHLYMNIGDASHTIDLTPGANDGVLYDGMTSDGTKVFFTTKDALSTSADQDTDTSADIYEANISDASMSLTRISTGSTGTGNTNSCHPVSGWNAAAPSENCDAMAIAGGGGVASESGAIYLLSPELLDGMTNGVANEPNLYVAGLGQTPRYVATIETSNPLIAHARMQAATFNYGDFQVAPSGDFAVFASALPLTGYNNDGHSEIYRYSQKDGLACISCSPTGAIAISDTTLPARGLSLTDDGRVFFTSSEQLVLRDTDRKKDAYEWEDGTVQLISTGTGETDSDLISISPDATNAYFFTRQVLAPQDDNGAAVKIYDARVGGGFAFDFPSVPCQASDECHGRGSQASPSPALGTLAGIGGNHVPGRHKRRPKHHHKPPHKRNHGHHTTRRHG